MVNPVPWFYSKVYNSGFDTNKWAAGVLRASGFKGPPLYGEKNWGLNMSSNTLIKDTNLSPWVPHPKRRIMKHRYCSLEQLDMTAGTPVIDKTVKCDNIANIFPSSTTSTPAVGFSEMRAHYQSYVVKGAKIAIKIPKLTASTPQFFYARIRFHDGQIEGEDKKVPRLPSLEWTMQVPGPRWIPINTLATYRPNKYYHTLVHKYSFGRSWRRSVPSLKLDEVAALKHHSLPTYTTYTSPIHYSVDPLFMNTNDRFYWTIEFTPGDTAIDPTNFRYFLYVEYTVEWFNPKVPEAGLGGFDLSDETTETVPNQHPGVDHEHFDTTAVTAGESPSWETYSDDDPDPPA